MRQLDAIHGSRHLDVREDKVNIVPHFEDTNCLIGVASFKRFVTCRYHEIDCAHADHRTVFHDQDDWFAIFSLDV